MRSLDGREVIWKQLPRQRLAMECPADEVMYGGQKGGGKSDFIIMAPVEQIVLADRKYRETGRRQRGRAVLFRKNLKRLDELIMRSKELFPSLDPGMAKRSDCGYFEAKKRWVFTSGYVFDFDHLDGPDDHEAYHGQEISALLFDQVEEIPYDVYQYLCANVRSKDDDMRKLLMVRCTANPGGKYAAWVKDYFVAPYPRGNKIITETMKLSRGREKSVTKCFIPAKLADNPYLDSDPAYEARLRKLPLHMQKMYLEGDWDAVIGSFFASSLMPAKHFMEAFPIPPSWEIKFGMDWGTVKPAACIFGTRDNDGNVYIVDEIYGPGGTGRLFAERFKKKLTTQRWSDARKWEIDDMYGLLDYATWSKHGEEGPTPAVSMQNAGMRLFKANKDVKAGVEQILERLAFTDGAPKLYIFEDRCPNLVRELKTIATDPKEPDRYDSDGEDHAIDALRYLLIDWPIGTAPENDKGDRDLERWMELAKKRDHIRDAETTTGYD